MHGDFTELRVLEVLVEGEARAVTALRVEAVWGTRKGDGEPDVWSRSVFVVGAHGSLAEADEGDVLQLVLAR